MEEQEEQEEILDPQNELIQALFNKTGYKANFRKVVETITSGNEFKDFPFYSSIFLPFLVKSFLHW